MSNKKYIQQTKQIEDVEKKKTNKVTVMVVSKKREKWGKVE